MALSVESRAAGAVDVILRDGGTLRLRPPSRGDADALVAFFARLSRAQPLPALPRHPRASTAQLVEPFLDPDWVETRRARRHAGSADERVVALANYARLRDPGVGRGRLRRRRRGAGPRDRHAPARAARRARAGDGGIARFVAEVLADEPRDARRLRRRRLRGRRASSSSGEVEVQLPDRADRDASGRASRSATTSPSPPRCARSSSRAASP